MADFTIVTPVLNQVKYIERCILSVLEQNCDVQYIIIDGGSTDGTIEVIRKYENRISYWESGRDSGQSSAINKGLKLAKGKFFNWLNADDQLAQNSLNTVLRLASKDAKIIVGKCEHVDEAGNKLEVGGTGIWESLEATLGNYSMGQPSTFYLTEILVEFGGLNPYLHYCMDMDLWFRFLTTHGQTEIVSTDRVLSQFLVHSNSKSVDSAQEMTKEKYGIYRALLNQFDLPKILIEFFKDFPIPTVEPKDYHIMLNTDILLANFCWHLMQDEYEKGELSKCQDYFEIVKKGQRLSESEKLKWRVRLAAKKALI